MTTEQRYLKTLKTHKVSNRKYTEAMRKVNNSREMTQNELRRAQFAIKCAVDFVRINNELKDAVIEYFPTIGKAREVGEIATMIDEQGHEAAYMAASLRRLCEIHGEGAIK